MSDPIEEEIKAQAQAQAQAGGERDLDALQASWAECKTTMEDHSKAIVQYAKAVATFRRVVNLLAWVIFFYALTVGASIWMRFHFGR